MPDDLLPHERPVYVVLPAGASAGAALARFLARPEVRTYRLPSPWFLEAAGVDLPAALRGVRAVEASSVETVLEAAERLCTPALLAQRVARQWREADEQVRQHFLKRSTLQLLAGIFRFGPRTRDLAPPPEFVADRIHECGFEVQYRLEPERGAEEYPAPPEEGSLVAYPFDPRNELARRELGLGAATGPILEAFAYVWQHARHRALWQAFADDLGAHLLSPA